MSNICTKNFLLSLAWITTGEKTPNYFEAVFSLKDITTEKVCLYVAFPFVSFDLLNLYLKILARTCKVCSVDNLFHANHLVKVEYEEPFSSPPIFKYLYVNDNDDIWPTQKISGHFLNESFS